MFHPVPVLALVSPSFSGIPEHVRDGETGLLVAEGDVAGMAEALARLLADPGLARRMGAAGRAHALEHLGRARSRARIRDLLGLPAPVETPEWVPPPEAFAGASAAGGAMR